MPRRTDPVVHIFNIYAQFVWLYCILLPKYPRSRHASLRRGALREICARFENTRPLNAARGPAEKAAAAAFEVGWAVILRFSVKKTSMFRKKFSKGYKKFQMEIDFPPEIW